MTHAIKTTTWTAGGMGAHAPWRDAQAPAAGRRTTQLTERQRQVLELLAAGHSVPAAAARLELRPRYVYDAVQRIIDKYRLQCREDAIALYRAGGMG